MIFKNFLLGLFSAANLSHSIYKPDAPEMNLHILQNIFQEKHAETNFAFCLASKPLKVRSIKVEWPVIQLCHHNNKLNVGDIYRICFSLVVSKQKWRKTDKLEKCSKWSSKSKSYKLLFIHDIHHVQWHFPSFFNLALSLGNFLIDHVALSALQFLYFSSACKRLRPEKSF